MGKSEGPDMANRVQADGEDIGWVASVAGDEASFGIEKRLASVRECLARNVYDHVR